ncbi:ankyrin repeat-containing domain protein [Tricladium varicosporioides]|nr:ankyrin repeat-containing domain protein [Hymenoscyphus varicosporioides]
MDLQDTQDFVLLEEKDVDDYNEDGILPQAPEVLAQILEWLQPTDFLSDSSEYKKHLNSYVSGTGLWVQNDKAYHQWHDDPDHGSLWIKATAGAGKSVFAAMTAARLAREESVPVLSFFFRQIVSTNHDPHGLVRDWIAMALHHSPPLQLAMKSYLENRTLENVSTLELWEDLLNGLASIPKVYCVVDALDEMDIENMDFLRQLVDLGKQKPSSIKIMMTSRPLPRIESILKDPSVLQIRLEPAKVNRDISVYIGYRLINRMEVNDELRRAIKLAIGDRAQGSFLYARLMMDEILDHLKQMIPDVKYLRRSLDWLPVTLEDMYNGMLLDHSLRSRVSQDLQLIILRWVTHSSRPLRLLEIAAMLDFLNNSSANVKDTKSIVRVACGPLLEILEDETVSVIHHSFTEFLTDKSRIGRESTNATHQQFPVVSGEETHSSIAMTCLAYLEFALKSWDVSRDLKYIRAPGLLPPPPRHLHRSKFDQQQFKLMYPFLDYTLGHWYGHVACCRNLEGSLCSSLDDFIQYDKHTFLAWLDITWTTQYSERLSPLHIAAWAGLTKYAELLLQRGAKANERDEDGKTPLLWSSTRGNPETTALLLEHVSDLDLQDVYGMTPLHYAAQGGHHATVKLLLDAGASPLIDRSKNRWRRESNPQYPGMSLPPPPPPPQIAGVGDSPLYLACNLGSTASVCEMIPHITTKDLNDALLWAAFAGKSDLVSMLLDVPGVTPNFPEYSDTPLYFASCGWHFETMQLLLNKGADPSKRSSVGSNHRSVHHRGRGLRWNVNQQGTRLGSTPLHAIAGASRRRLAPGVSADDLIRKCLMLLLEAGCDINAVDDLQKTALHLSLGSDGRRFQHTCLSNLLLENGADPMARDVFGNTPLHLIQLELDTAPLIKSFLEHGADIQIRRPSDGSTPLHTMLFNINRADIRPLLPFVSDWNITDNEGNTPLHIVMSQSRPGVEAVQQLLQAGADPRIQNKRGETPLHLARTITNETEELAFAMLVSAGAGLETRDNNGCTVLMRAIDGRHQNSSRIVEFFVEQGARFDVYENAGNCLLHVACRRFCNAPMVSALIKAGADPLRVNHSGNTVLHELCFNYLSAGESFAAVVDIFLKAGVSPSARNHSRQTAAHHFFSSSPSLDLHSNFDPTEEFFQSELAKYINCEDYQRVRPIHLAATISETLVNRLIKAGAQTDCVTSEGKTLLHVAARMRQSNIIGLLIDHYTALDQLNILDRKDKEGRTALHEAATSGRPESVAILLDAGSNPRMTDNYGNTPLHACADFEKENSLWRNTPGSRNWPSRAGGVLTTDQCRPMPQDDFTCLQQPRQPPPARYSKFSSESTVRIRDVIKLLLRYGADVGIKNNSGCYASDLARDHCCSSMVDELFVPMQTVLNQQVATSEPGQMLESVIMLDRYFISQQNFKISEGDIERNRSNFHTFHQLLTMGQFSMIRQLPEMGVDFYPKVESEAGGDYLSTLVHWGYSDLLLSVGMSLKDTQWTNGVRSPDERQVNVIKPYLIQAASARLPNLEVIKTLIETFDADVNVQQQDMNHKRDSNGAAPVRGASALHILAASNHWWQTEALKYLLSKGADVELMNSRGETALHVAVSSMNREPYRASETIRILLQHGANVNHLDDDGLTCLNKATRDIELLQVLIEGGADTQLGSKPVLLSAIDDQNITVVAALLKAGANCNQKEDIEESVNSITSYSESYRDCETLPIHYSASSHFNNMKDRDTAMKITKLLLDHGADYSRRCGSTLIIHDLFHRGGILQPFLDIKDLDLEQRDGGGRTLLLAACRSSHGTSTPVEARHDYRRSQDEIDQSYWERSKGDPTPARTLFERGSNLFAVDNDGNNALHHMLDVRPFNKEQYRNTFKLFMDKGRSLIQQGNAKGFKPFHCALKLHNKWAIKTLLEAGTNPLEVDPDGNSPLHHLASAICSKEGSASWLPLFEKFQSLGNSLDQKNNRGETPIFLYYAAMGRYDEPGCHTKYFAPFENANILATNNNGETLLHICAKWKLGLSKQHISEVVDSFTFLMGKGLDPMAEDHNQRTALDVAAAYEHNDILALFQRDSGLYGLSEF